MLRSKLLLFTLVGVTLATAIAVAAAFMVRSSTSSSAQTETETLDFGAGTRYVGPGLWGLLYKHAREEDTPETVDVRLGVDPDIKVGVSLSDQITAAGGSHVRDDVWRVPTRALLAVVQRLDVFYAEFSPQEGASGQVDPYPQMSRILKRVMASRAAGVPDDQAALQAWFARDGAIAVGISMSTAARKRQVKAWLVEQGIHIPVGNEESDDHLGVTVMLPVDKMEPLTALYSDVELQASDFDGQGLTIDRSFWPEDSRTFEDYYIDLVLGKILPPDPDADPDSGSDSVASGQNGDPIRAWERDLAARLEAHGADEWIDGGKTGLGVKVGNPGLGLLWSERDPVLGRHRSVYDSETNINGNAFCQDVAPSAKLFYAQANSPRQLHDAVNWLNDTKNVDVIVHAAGWTYDGKGDGTSPLIIDLYTRTATVTGGNEHSPYRYYPSPLNTVDYVTIDPVTKKPKGPV